MGWRCLYPCRLVSLITTSNIQTAVTSLNISEIEIQYLWPFLCTLAFGIAGAILSLWTQGTERLAQSIFKVFSCVSVGSVAVITIYIIVSGAPALAEIGVGNFLFGTEWEASSEIFGILPMILSSIVGTIGAIIIGVPVGLLTAIFLSETANPILAKIVRPAVELLAGIPSVIYGFFGMLVIVPAIRTFPPFQGHTTGGHYHFGDYGPPNHRQCFGDRFARGSGFLPGGVLGFGCYADHDDL